MSESDNVAQLPVPMQVRLPAGSKLAPIVPRDLEDTFRMAKAVAASGLAPKGMNSPEQVMVAILHGMEIGLPPMQAIQRIAVINGRPSIWGDAVPAILFSKGFKLRERIEGTSEHAVAHCVVVRPDGEEIERTFSVPDARKAGLWGKAGPWTQHPLRMLAMRARGFAARDGAADALSGLYLAEEASDIVDVKPRKSSAQAKRDGTNETFNEIVKEIQEASTIEVLDHIIDNARADDIAELPMRWHDLVQNEAEQKRKDLGGSAA